MVVWRNVIKGIVKASLPTIILPALVIGVVIKRFGFTLDSLLAILFLGQIYIVWAQLEVALRQTRVSVLEYEPEFKIEIEYQTISLGEGRVKRYHVKLRNIGKHLARNIKISAGIMPATKERKPEHKFNFVSNMAPNDSVTILSIDEEVFLQEYAMIDLDYENILGEIGGVGFLKFKDSSEFRIVKTVEMPGILLKSFEDLIRISKLFTFQRRNKRIREEQEKIKKQDSDPTVESPQRKAPS